MNCVVKKKKISNARPAFLIYLIQIANLKSASYFHRTLIVETLKLDYSKAPCNTNSPYERKRGRKVTTIKILLKLSEKSPMSLICSTVLDLNS